MANVRVNVRIGDRQYKMKDVTADQEAILRKAEKILNELLKEKMNTYLGQTNTKSGILLDKQDIYAMSAFECVLDKVMADEQNSDSSRKMSSLLADVHKSIDEGLFK